MYFVSFEDLQFIPEPKTVFIVATLNLVFDESGKAADKTHVVYAGFIIDQGEHWSELGRRWRILLFEKGITTFKASEAFSFNGPWRRFRGKSDERDALLRDLAGLSLLFPREATGTIINADAFKALPKAERDRYKGDAFYCAFEQGILNGIQHSGISPEDNFNLICDDSEEYAPECLRVYRRFTKEHPDIAERLGTICFGDDEKVVPLQMADMLAYCLRRQAENAPDGIWKEILDIFLRSEGVTAERRPVVVKRPSARMIFRLRLGLLIRSAKGLFSR